MNLASLFIRAVDNRGAIYRPFDFQGDWSEEDKITVTAAIAPHVPEAVYAMFNNWLFSRISDRLFVARRATWDMGSLGAETAAELAEKITDYYTHK